MKPNEIVGFMCAPTPNDQGRSIGGYLRGRIGCVQGHGPKELKLRVLPDRPGRFEPRAVKRRPNEYNRLTKPRQVLRKRLERQKDAA